MRSNVNSGSTRTISKRFRDDKGYWSQVEAYIQHHSEARFSHGIRPECAEKYYAEFNLYGESRPRRPYP